MRRGLAAVIAATSLISATAAVAAPAASRLSIASSAARVGAPVSRVNNQEGAGNALIGIGVIAAIVAVFLVLAEGDNNPVSA